MIRLINSTLLRDDLLSQGTIIFGSNQSGASLDPSTTGSNGIVTGRLTANDVCLRRRRVFSHWNGH